ncbi:DUF7305 domain-containing protein [Halomonas sp. HL-93]|uniref:DUF7305 domain-containing protein n=1 Tax=Halomonas sp. HL-93 TaxID=1666906 RepID=UPI0006DAB373|nr:PilX N-terminal domain-containing pilus assembly protein [Halomonas sp. HL-93]KPQ21909.1 MAG: Protein of unknown function, DUF583 [Halomonas sp. HL-93]SBR46179.1 hypothetical protein GA0071314_0591 [Halomonas sp. HL-93]
MKQQGAALVIVMALLAGAMTLGLSGMQTALVDERLAGNYRASTQAQMTAENTLSALVDPDNTTRRNEYLNDLLANNELVSVGQTKSLRGREVEALLEEGALDDFFKQLLPNNYEELSSEDQAEIHGTLVENFVLEFERLEGDQIAITALDDGLRQSARGQSRLVYALGEGSGNPTPFQSPVVGCEGVSSGGGSIISSYRSSDGGWSGEPGRFASDDLPLLRTTTENANVELGGNEQLHGGIEALGSVTMTGSSQVFGSILANQNVNLNAGGGRVRGNVDSLSNVLFGSSTRVDGEVRAEQDIRFSNYAASVGEAIYAGGDIISSRDPVSDHLDAANRQNFMTNAELSLTPIAEQDCDPIDFNGKSLKDEIVRYQDEIPTIGDVTVGSYPNEQWRFTPTAMSRFDKTWNVNRWVEHAEPTSNTLMEEPTSFYRVNHLRLTSSPSLRVSGGDIAVIVDGDFTMDGGGAGLVIDDDSSLTIFVSGRVDFGSVLNMPEANSLNNQGNPTFSIFSGYSGNQTGVNFSASNRVVANVYAPYTDISVNSGSDFFGSLRGQRVTVSGSGSIVYDELLASAFSESISGSGSGDSTRSGWQLVDWQ